MGIDQSRDITLFELWWCSSVKFFFNQIEHLSLSSRFRGLGVNLSKVRSVHMDTWDLETLLVMSELGNTIVNSIYEAQIPNDIRKPSMETDAYDER